MKLAPTAAILVLLTALTSSSSLCFAQEGKPAGAKVKKLEVVNADESEIQSAFELWLDALVKKDVAAIISMTAIPEGEKGKKRRAELKANLEKALKNKSFPGFFEKMTVVGAMSKADYGVVVTSIHLEGEITQQIGCLRKQGKKWLILPHATDPESADNHQDKKSIAAFKALKRGAARRFKVE